MSYLLKIPIIYNDKYEAFIPKDTAPISMVADSIDEFNNIIFITSGNPLDTYILPENDITYLYRKFIVVGDNISEIINDDIRFKFVGELRGTSNLLYVFEQLNNFHLSPFIIPQKYINNQDIIIEEPRKETRPRKKKRWYEKSIHTIYNRFMNRWY